MIYKPEIWEALEASAVRKNPSLFMPSATVNKAEIILHRDLLLRFLENLDGEISVLELCEALDEYR